MEHQKHDTVTVTYLTIIKNRRALLALVSAVVSLIFTLFFDGILANHLIIIGVSPNLIGYFFGIIALVFAISSPLIGLLSRVMPTRYIT